MNRMRNIAAFLLLTNLLTSGLVAEQHLGAPSLNGPSITSCYAVTDLQEISYGDVAEQKKDVIEYLERNQTHRIMVRAATVAALTAVVGYGVYHWYLKPFPDPATIAQVPVTDLTEATRDISKIKDKIEFLEFKMAKEYKIPLVEKIVIAPTTYVGMAAAFSKDVAVSGFGLLKYFGSVMLSAGPPMLLTSLALRELPTVTELWARFISAPVDKICHPSDSRWFLNNQVHYKDMFKHLEYRVNQLPLASDEHERIYFVSQIITDLNLLTKQLTRVIAFLEIQSERVLEKNKVCGAHLTNKAAYIFTLVQNFTRTMAVLLEEKNKHAEVPASFSEFQRKLKDEFYSFDLYERAAFHDIIPL